MKSKFKCVPGRSGIMWIAKYVMGQLLQSYRALLISRWAGAADKWGGANKLPHTSRKVQF